MLKYKTSSRFWWFGLLSIVFFAAAFYLIIFRGPNISITDQYLLQEKTVARAIAKNYEGFFQVLGNSAAFRAQLSNKRQWDSTTQDDMDDFVNQWRDSGLIAGVILADTKGVVRLNSNTRGVSDVGSSIADRDYFTWAKNQSESGKYMIGQPVISRLGASKDQLIVPVSSPVFVDDVFRGVLSTAVKLEPLTKRFMENMKVSDETSVYLIDGKKEILYKSSNSPELDKNLINSLGSDNQDKFRKNNLLIAYSTANLGEQKWMVVVVSPIKEMLGYTLPFYIRQAAVLVFLSLTTLIFGIIVGRRA